MSGRTKRILYYVADSLLLLGTFAVFLLVGFASFTDRPVTAGEIAAAVLWAVSVLLRIPALVHELGHLLFGIFAGMKPVSFTFWCIRFAKGRPRFVRSDFAGKIEMFPKNAKRLYGKTVFYTFGGAVLDLLAGAALLAVYLTLPRSNFAVLYAGLFAPFLFFEGVRALLPAELPAGKTDGAVLLGLFMRRPEEEIMLRALTVQGILYRGRFSDVPRALLFETPVVREDLPAFRALLFFRMQYLLSRGEEEEAKETLARFREIEGLSEEEKREAERYEGYFSGEFAAAEQPLAGVWESERKLAEKK